MLFNLSVFFLSASSFNPITGEEYPEDYGQVGDDFL